jgi:hypothetical protein
MSTSQFKKGDRVRLIRTEDEFTRLEFGDLGTVLFVDDLGTIHVKWDAGSTLGMVPESGDRIERVD